MGEQKVTSLSDWIKSRRPEAPRKPRWLDRLQAKDMTGSIYVNGSHTPNGSDRGA